MPIFIRNYLRILRALLSDSICRYKTKSLLIVIASAVGLLSQISAFAIVFYYVNHVASGELIKIDFWNTEINFDPRASLDLLILVSSTILLFLVVSALLVFYSRSLSIRLSRLYNEHCIETILSNLGGTCIPRYNKNQAELLSDRFFQRLLISDARICGRVLRLVLTLIFPVLTLIVSFSVLFYLDVFLTCIIFAAMSVYLYFQGNISKRASNFSSVFEIHTPAASKKIIDIFNISKQSQLGFSANLNVHKDIFNFGPFKKQLDAYEARRRYVEYSRLVSGIFIAIILGLITLIMGERILASKSGWGELIIFVVALRAAMMNLQPVFNQITSINRFYPQLRRYFNFINNYYFKNAQFSDQYNQHYRVAVKKPILETSELFMELRAPSKVAVLFPNEINKLSAYKFLNLIFYNSSEHYYSIAKRAAFITVNSVIPDDLTSKLRKQLQQKQINGISFPEALSLEIDMEIFNKDTKENNLANSSENSKLLISAISVVLADKKIILLDADELEKLSLIDLDFLFELLNEKILLILYKKFSSEFAKWHESDVILMTDSEILGVGSLEWVQANRMKIEVATVNACKNARKKPPSQLSDNDLDDFE